MRSSTISQRGRERQREKKGERQRERETEKGREDEGQSGAVETHGPDVLPRSEKQSKVCRTFARNSRPESGLDCHICAIYSRGRGSIVRNSKEIDYKNDLCARDIQENV
jgi:hypothetical protein